MAWDEWEQLKAEAASRQSARMQLNSIPAEPGGGGTGAYGDLKVHDKDLAAVGNAARELHKDFGDVSDRARLSSMSVVDSMKKSDGFQLGEAMDHVAVHWVDQAQSLLDATAHIANHLHVTQSIHAKDEVYIAGTISSIATLDQGFDERTTGK
ncbi:hypothetical protein [Streptomyces sp. NK08204]|uniref:hypothetical protein n=1 Tax=Streptomyces sp. NK08204 TaxID=2873260 RepID=UPI001CECC2AC|nr:hypothetical protein [Streptomyces sp. NK08204]